MSDILSPVQEEPTERPRRRASSERPSRAKRTGHARRRINPPNNVQPGWAHNMLAALTLKAFQEKGGDPGVIDDEFVKMIPGAEDSPEPAVLLARVYAHLAWRLPLVRALAKRFEGKEAKAGLASDMLALAAQLYLRNRDLFTEFRSTQTARMTATKRSPESPGREQEVTSS